MPYTRKFYGRKKFFKKRSFTKRSFGGFKRSLMSKTDRASLQGLYIKFRADFAVTFTFAVGNSISLPIHVPVLFNTLTTGTCIVNATQGLYQAYANLYDQAQLKWARIGSAVAVFPSGITALKMYTTIDRKAVASSSELITGNSNVVNSPSATISTLNSSQYSKMGIMTKAILLQEKAGWFDTTTNAQNNIPDVNQVGCFTPSFTMVLQMPAAPTGPASVTVTFDATFAMKFKNPKPVGNVTQTNPFTFV